MQANRITGVNELDDARKQTAHLYLRMSGLKAVLVGAFCGVDDWDVRPLVLRDNKTSLLRLSDPAIPIGSPDLNRFALEYQEVSRQPGLFGNAIEFGRASGRVWALRPYYSETLAEPGLLTQLRSQHGSEQLLKDFLDQVRSLHDLGLVHGNLCLENLTYVQGRIVLLDFAFDALTRIDHKSGIPEIMAGADLASPADVHSLARMIGQFLGPEQISKHNFLLQAMQQMAPENRPSIGEICLDLFPNAVMTREVKKPKHIISGVSLTENEGVTRGRLINPAEGMTRSRTASLNDIPREEILSKIQQAESRNISRQPIGQPHVPTEIVSQVRGGMGEQAISAPRPGQYVPGSPDPSVKKIPQTSQQTFGRVPSTSKPQAVRTQPEAQTNPQQSSFSAFTLVSLTFVVVAALYGAGVLKFRIPDTPGKNIPFEKYWVSDQPSLMNEVAYAAAVEGNERARRVILADVQAGSDRLGVNSVLLKAASNRLWYSSFQEKDRSLLFRIALIDIIPDALEDAPALATAHPGLLFGVIASLSPRIEQGWYGSVNLARFATLPAPLGPAFVRLSKLGVKDLSNPIARGLAHLLVGVISPDALQAFSPKTDDAQLASQKLQILVPFLVKSSALASTFIKVVKQAESGLADLVSWFDQGSLDSWKKAGSEKLLLIASGELPDRELSFEQLSDLVRYVVPSIREQTAIYLAGKYFKEQDFNTLAFLTSRASKLSREQTVFLLSALRLEGEAAYTFIAKWFETNPDPRSVFGILLARKGIPDFDPVSVDAARYIKDKEWKATLNELELASDHPEPLLRALIYARLDPQNKAHRVLLKDRARNEPEKRLRQQLHAKLTDSQLEAHE